MELPTRLTAPRSGCAGGELRRRVDEVRNAAAIDEATQATDELQVSTEAGEGPTFYDGKEVRFEPLSAACYACGVTVTVDGLGRVTAPKCASSGVCEEQFVATSSNEAFYAQDKPVHCAPIEGPRCSAVFEVKDGELCLKVGKCAIADKEKTWQATMWRSIREEKTT